MWQLFRRGQTDPENRADKRLDTWKEIAAYLKRDVRTVQRWEKDEELPVHRHVHNRLATVYAYRHELDSWWNNRKERLEGSRGAGTTPVWKSRAAVPGISFAVLLMIGSAWYFSDSILQPRLSFQQRDWLLVAEFDNRTEDPFFDGTIRYAMERELSNSRFVNVVPRPRIGDVLRLMKKPSDTPVDKPLAREICLRDGQIKALLSGRLEKMGNDYSLSAELVDPTDGATIAGWSEAADDKDEILSAVRRLSQSVREGLGESIVEIEGNAGRLEKVTTPSLRALQLFSEGDMLLHQRTHAAAAELFRRALGEDPHFATAHMWLAWALRNDGFPKEKWLPHVEESVRLSANVSEPERLVILAKAHSIQGEVEEGVPLYEALLRLDPDHYWGTNNLMWSYQKLGRLEDFVRLLKNFVRLRPRDPGVRFQLAFALANQQFDFEPAAKHLYQLRELLREQQIEPDWAWGAAWMELYPVLRSLAEDRPVRALSAADSIELKSFQEPVRSQVAAHLVLFNLTMGRLSEARELLAKITTSKDRLLVRLDTALWERNDSEAEKLALQLYEDGERIDPVTAAVLARTGHVSQAQEILRGYESGTAPERFRWFLSGEIASAQGDSEEARRALDQALEAMKKYNTSALYLAAETLAKVHEEEGRSLRALQVLEGVGDKRRLINPNSGPYWSRTQLQLLNLYEAQGLQGEKTRLEAGLRRFLGSESYTSLRSSVPE